MRNPISYLYAFLAEGVVLYLLTGGDNEWIIRTACLPGVAYLFIYAWIWSDELLASFPITLDKR